VRGNFKFGPNHYPTQNYYMQEVVKEGDTYTQKTIATAEENEPNPHASQCSMK
jgi:branched-chain amino acid transport system substrate-binding protein